MMMMKKMNVVVVLLVLCVMASNVEQSFAQVSCYDACSTHCAVQYMKKLKLMARCDRKCSEKCRRGGKGEFQVEENIN